jgi:hypothetical protein
MPDDFSFGCPGCGYSLPANPAPEPIKAYAPAQAAPPVPWWVFIAVAAVLLLLCLALAYTLA